MDFCIAYAAYFSYCNCIPVHVAAGSLDRRNRVPFQIPHSLAFATDKRELLVADRENGRVQCFMVDTGEFVKEIKKNEFGGEVFAVSYSPAQGNHHIHFTPHSHLLRKDSRTLWSWCELIIYKVAL